MLHLYFFFLFFFFNDTATTEIYTLSLHDALPISTGAESVWTARGQCSARRLGIDSGAATRSEEHTSELQSQSNLVCRLLLEKKKMNATRLVVPNDVVRLCSMDACRLVADTSDFSA